MENALLVGLSHQAALKRHMNILANNLANLSTAGFKSEKPVFEDFVMPMADVGEFTGEAADIHYVQDTSLFRDFAPGPLKNTGNDLDVAITGEGWFVLEGPEGELFTKNGHFHLDPDGQVVTSDGLAVLSDNGPIVIADGENDVEISADGTITTNLGVKGRLQFVEFDDEALLRKQGSSAYSAEDQEPVPSANVKVAQGTLEGSNVNAVKEITAMISVTRAYTSAAEMLKSANTLRQTAIQQLGQAPA